MMWIITTIVLGCIAILTLIYNAIKDAKIKALEYEVSYLLNIIFYGHGDVVLRQRDNELTDEEARKIKDGWNKWMK